MNDAPLREIKPLVVPAQYFIWGPLISGFLSVFPAGFAFVLSNMLSIGKSLHEDPFERAQLGPVVGYGVAAYILSFVVCMVLLGLRAFYQPGLTTYTIFPDRIEYDEGFLNRKRRTVLFDQVIDVKLVESVLQQTRGAGTVTLVTQQLVGGGDGRLSNREIDLVNVPEPRTVYDLVREQALKKGGS